TIDSPSGYAARAQRPLRTEPAEARTGAADPPPHMRRRVARDGRVVAPKRLCTGRRFAKREEGSLEDVPRYAASVGGIVQVDDVPRTLRAGVGALAVLHDCVTRNHCVVGGAEPERVFDHANSHGVVVVHHVLANSDFVTTHVENPAA